MIPNQDPLLLRTSDIQKQSPVPLYFQLKNLILNEIEKGSYPVGSCIPTEKEFVETFQLSRTTVRQALSELVSGGVLYRVKSKGTFVSQPKIKHDFIKKLESFDEQMTRLGMSPSTILLEKKVVRASPEIAQHLQISPNDPVLYLFRKRLANNRPLVTIKTYLPYQHCAFLQEHDLQKERLYHLLASQDDTRVCKVERIFEAVSATAEDEDLLGLTKGKPLHYFKSVGFNEQEIPIEYSLARYRGDASKFEITVFLNNDKK